ncbi:alpha/beta hydrolase [Erythrobacter sp. KY5]|uniref:alpha/beta fold hydrolase n=1 Tax=Erythrobacter sp. KY5 TaxID=2011159 RepID=UPI000DBF03A8|nr:alpha/beta fold hydrolase [Erythrobacter sp. KY5]AWW73486.1 alpha/beta hydrolase [Erythrobacter sp. KY5]
MPHITANGIELCYETHGNPRDETILLVMGLGAQLAHWPIEFVEALASKGYHVVRYDNRDIGLSQKMGDAKPPKLVWQLLRKRIGFPMAVPYTLRDMADDGIALLEALEIERAHVVGASMGGMIAQLMAIHHAERLLSLTSVMSTTGNPRLPQAEKRAIEALTAPLPSMEEEAVIEHGINIARNITGPGFPADPEARRKRVQALVQRSVYPPGLPRQLAAIIDDGDRRSRLAQVTTPTLVLHGEDDPLVKLEAGKDTAKHIPGAKLVTIPGWGHDLPLDLVDRMVDEITGHTRSVSTAQSVSA